MRATDTAFSRQVVGHSTLERIIPEMMSAANIVGFFTLHSLRATCATRLYNKGMDEQAIMEVTGHSSLAVREYKRTGDGVRQQVSSILQVRDNNKENGDKLQAVETASENEVVQDQGSSSGSGKKRLKLQCGELLLDVTF